MTEPSFARDSYPILQAIEATEERIANGLADLSKAFERHAMDDRERSDRIEREMRVQSDKMTSIDQSMKSVNAHLSDLVLLHKEAAAEERQSRVQNSSIQERLLNSILSERNEKLERSKEVWGMIKGPLSKVLGAFGGLILVLITLAVIWLKSGG